MDTSDDPFITPTTLAAAGLGMGIATATGAFDRGVGDIGVAKAGQAKKTAEPVAQLSEQAKRKRRLAASSLTKEWAEPTLGIPGLFGM